MILVMKVGNKIRSRIVLDTETGVIVGELDKGDRVLKYNSIESYRRMQESKYIKDKQDKCQDRVIDYFYKGNIAEIRAIMKELDTYEKAFLYSIAPFISYEDCCLKYDNGKELNFNTLSEISGISKGKLSETIKKLIDKDILYKGKNSKNTQYFVNPWLFCKGNRINKVLKTMFKNYKIRTLGVRWREL